MVASNFERAFNFVLADMKGDTADSHDGISQDQYAAWGHIHGSPVGSVAQISPQTVKAIYFIDFWSPWCDRLPNGIDYLFFDCCITMGAAEAAIVLQRALDLEGRLLTGNINILTVVLAQRYEDKAKLAESMILQHDRNHALLLTEVGDLYTTQLMYGWKDRIAH